jgi:glycosyltransferase involved in cell wall biosynthesis
VGFSTLKVFFIAYEYPPNTFGGFGSFSKEFVDGLLDRGISFYVLSLQRFGRFSIERMSEKLTVIRAPTLNLPPRHFWWQLLNLNSINKLIDKISPDIIHANSPVAALALKRFSEKTTARKIVTIHTDNRRIFEIFMKHFSIIEPKDFLMMVAGAPIHETLLKFDIDSADYAVAVAKHVENDIKNRSRITKISTIYNGINFQTMLNNQLIASDKKNIRLAFAGRLYWIKGITYLLKAMKELAEKKPMSRVQLNIYGDGPLRRYILEKSKNIEKNPNYKVVFHGNLPRDRFLLSLQSNDIVLFPSLYEACPMTLIEALSLNKAVIVNSMPWSKEFIQNGINGLTTNTLDSKEFAETISTLMDDQILRQKISFNAGLNIEKFSNRKMALEYCNLYEDLYRK